MEKELVEVALGKSPADLAIVNGRLVNVDTCELLDNVGVAIKGRRIALVGDVKHCIGKTTKVIDAKSKFLVPGLLDAHVHIESSMLTPTRFAQAVLPRGTTGVFMDPHEIANVLGTKGIKLMIDETENLPLKFFITVPSCVPSAPGLETTGTELGSKDVAELLRLDRVVGLAEVMNLKGVLSGDRETFDKISIALGYKAVVEGHAPDVRGKFLAAYAAAGIKSDHESITHEEAIEKLRLGMKLELREGSVAKNLAQLIKPIFELKLDTRHCLLATDDRNPKNILEEGHVDHLVRLAIGMGVDPIRAIQMATINTAEHFRVDGDVGSISPGKLADVLIVEDLKRFKIEEVVADGELVAANGKLLTEFRKPSYPDSVRATIRIRPVHPKDFRVKAPVKEGKVKVRVIGLEGKGLITKYKIVSFRVKGGLIEPDPKRDIARVTVLERHHRTRRISLGFVQGLGMKEGAIGSSVGHDSHNLIVAGFDERDMAVAANSIARMGGGQIVVRKAEVLAKLELPIAGLMSDDPIEIVKSKQEKLERAARGLGISIDEPFMTLSFLQLAVVPELRITDKGLVDVENFKLVDLFVRSTTPF